MTPSAIVQFGASVALQVIALAMLPMTKGFTRPLPAIAVGLMFVVAIGLYARLVAAGVPLSVIVPLSSATIPLASILVGVVVHREPASPLRLVLLVAATSLVVVASRMSSGPANQ